jgi:enoyl-CoA hydratase/carnithine racemase
MAICGEVQGAFQDLQDDDEVPANILTGAGGDFAACADVGEMGNGGVRGNMIKSRTLHRMVRSVVHINKPVIAAVEGGVHGGGLRHGAGL